MPMTPFALRRVVLLLGLWALSGGCAVGGGPATSGPRTPPARTVDAIRGNLPAEYRGFYDQLADLGDWVLIQPFGWVFRPRVNFVAWRPYQDGFWLPTDAWGWMWISNEDFGVTYHYGEWFHDTYQGWVWKPDVHWGPAWVAWATTGSWIGWAPLAPTGYSGWTEVPGSVFTYVGANDLARGGELTRVLFARSIQVDDQGLQPIVNFSTRRGSAFNRGPDAALLQRLSGSRPEIRTDAPGEQATPPERPLAARALSEDALMRSTRAAVEAGRAELSQSAPDRSDAVVPRPPQWRGGTAVPKPSAQPLGGPKPTGDAPKGGLVKPRARPLGDPKPAPEAEPGAPAAADSTQPAADSLRVEPRHKPGAGPSRKPLPKPRSPGDSTER